MKIFVAFSIQPTLTCPLVCSPCFSIPPLLTHPGLWFENGFAQLNFEAMIVIRQCEKRRNIFMVIAFFAAIYRNYQHLFIVLLCEEIGILHFEIDRQKIIYCSSL